MTTATETYAPDIRACARCRHVLVDEDELGWYYQEPVTDSRAPGLTFMDRVHECRDHGQPHAVTPAARCTHPKCGRAIVRCEHLPPHGGCSSARGWVHVYSGAHACEPRSDGPYGEPVTTTQEASQ
jgi:hypothetical protein